MPISRRHTLHLDQSLDLITTTTAVTEEPLIPLSQGPLDQWAESTSLLRGWARAVIGEVHLWSLRSEGAQGPTGDRLRKLQSFWSIRGLSRLPQYIMKESRLREGVRCTRESAEQRRKGHLYWDFALLYYSCFCIAYCACKICFVSLDLEPWRSIRSMVTVAQLLFVHLIFITANCMTSSQSLRPNYAFSIIHY